MKHLIVVMVLFGGMSAAQAPVAPQLKEISGHVAAPSAPISLLK